MKLNCDLGESFGVWTMPIEADVMALLDQANVACGFHGGDASSIKAAISMAHSHHVAIGAHPSYPDLQGFGRRSMALSHSEIVDIIHYQMAVIDGLCRQVGSTMRYVKPHGALYNDMMKDADIRSAVMEAVGTYDANQTLMLQAHPDQVLHQREAKRVGVTLCFEAFADRRYNDEGFLVSRRAASAVLNHDEMLAQVSTLLTDSVIVSESGRRMNLHVDTLCVHGDTVGAVQMVRDIRQLLEQHDKRQ